MKGELPATVTAAYDVVGRYQQDQVNGFSEEFLDRFVEIIDPSSAATLLDAMAGDGNLTLRIYKFCRRRGIPFPSTVALERSRIQAEFARAALAETSARVVWGDVIDMKSLETGEPVGTGFDRVTIKSGNHEIPLVNQPKLYESVYRSLRPGGSFVNLGFLFEDPRERDELREIARSKDSLAGMHAAVVNRYFLTREEFYRFLRQAGFVDVRGAESFEYTIRSEVVAEQYFRPEAREEADLIFQTSQVRARTMRRKGRMRFELDRSVMICPGEITVARRPSLAEENALTFRQYPQDLLRHLEVHREMLDQAVAALPPGGAVLDLGCGIGLLAERLLDRPVSYTGLDISPELVGICRERFAGRPNFTFREADVNRLEMAPAAYDAVAILNTLNLPGIEAAAVIRRALAALRPGGRLIVAGPTSRESFLRAEPEMRRQLERDGLAGGNEAAWSAIVKANARLLTEHGNYWSCEGMAQLLRELGAARISISHNKNYYGHAFFVVAEK